MGTCCIVGIRVSDRAHLAGEVQRVLTEYGCNIKTRLGLHDVAGDACSPSGLIVLQVVGGEKVCSEMLKKLGSIKGVQTKSMSFEA
jgi:hypothetical protein